MGLTRIRENDMQISTFFVNGDIKGAIDYMRDHEEFKDIRPGFVARLQNQKYRTYEILDDLNNILRLYQIYFRDTFSCGSPRRKPQTNCGQFLVSFLKHEAQHTVDMKCFPEITPAELEYRAKLVELHYSSDLSLLLHF